MLIEGSSDLKKYFTIVRPKDYVRVSVLSGVHGSREEPTYKVLHQTPYSLETIRLEQPIYAGRKLLGITGEIEYGVIEKTIGQVEYLETLINNILSHAVIMGIGVNRTIGFGHAKIRLYNKRRHEI